MDRAPRGSVAKIRGRSIVCHSKVATSSRAIVKSAETECEEQDISLAVFRRAQERECFDPLSRRAVRVVGGCAEANPLLALRPRAPVSGRSDPSSLGWRSSDFGRLSARYCAVKAVDSPTASHSPKDRHQQRNGECWDSECDEQTLRAPTEP